MREIHSKNFTALNKLLHYILPQINMFIIIINQQLLSVCGVLCYKLYTSCFSSKEISITIINTYKQILGINYWL